MTLLLDTHAIIWFILDDPQLPKKTKNLIKDTDNRVCVSIASYWELSIKFTLGRLEFTDTLEEILDIITRSDLELLQISPKHLLRVATLQHHHRDPFDRLIIGQALEENMSLVSKDRQFKEYEGLGILWE